MKSTLFLFFAFFITVSFAQQSNHDHHLCAKQKIEAWQKATHKTNKSLNGQEKYDIHYVKLELDVDNLSTEIFAAKTTIKANVVGVSLDVLVLELLNSLTVDSAKINGIIVSTNRNGDELQVFPQNTLTNGTNFTAEIYYHGTQPTTQNYSEGIFNERSPSWGVDATYTLSEPFGASTWWAAKQVLTDKIDSSEVWITVPNTLKAGSNGLLVNELNLSGGKKQFQWKHQHPINYYLLSIAVGPYVDYSFTANLPNNQNIFVQNYIYDAPGLLTQFQTEIDKTADMLVEFSDKFGAYPFADEKYGHCMAPLSGGMEHQTMTTQGFFVESLTAHELGHQWFGNQVTCQTWGHIWINEGFASYSEYLFEESYNYQNAQNTMQSVHNSVLSQPGGSVYVYDQTNENAIFSSRLSYDKGSALVHMIRHWINDDQLFFTALKEFQNTYKNSTATAEDFFATVENLVGIDLQNELQHWYYGEGYPTFDVRFNNANSGLVVELSQTGSVAANPFFETSLELKIDFMDNTDTIIRVDNSFNFQQYSFNITKDIYAISIDPNNWILNKDGSVTEDNNLTFTSVIDLETIHFSLFPNPNNGQFSITNSSDEASEYQIFNALGKEVQNGILIQGENTINLITTSGVYFIKVNNNYLSFIVA